MSEFDPQEIVARLREMGLMRPSEAAPGAGAEPPGRERSAPAPRSDRSGPDRVTDVDQGGDQGGSQGGVGSEGGSHLGEARSHLGSPSRLGSSRLGDDEPAGPAAEGARAPVSLDELAALDADEAIALACARVCGIDTAVGVHFPCVLPGHEPAPGSAVLWREPAHERVVYRDLRVASGHRSYSLAEVFAARHSGRTARVQGPVLARWKLLLLHRAGLITPQPVELPHLDQTDDVIRQVLQGLRLLVGLRRLREPEDEPFAFSRRFARDWCQVSEADAYRAIRQLIADGILHQVGSIPTGHQHPMPLYRLGSPDDAA